MRHVSYGQCTKVDLFSAPVFFSDYSLLSVGDIFRRLLLFRKESRVYSKVSKTLNCNNCFKSEQEKKLNGPLLHNACD